VASVWYFFRELDYPHIREMFEIGNSIARGAAMMSGTEVSWRILGSAWPTWFNQPVAETMYENIRKVGLPQWSEADQELAKAVQRQAKSAERGLATELVDLGLPVKEEDRRGGGSDDIGDVSWTVPTVTLRYPSNLSGLPGHSWLNSIAAATPIAHKGVTAGAKVVAYTMLDILTTTSLVERAWTYFRDVQTKDVKYTSLLGPEDKPAVELNRRIMERYRPEMRKFYYDPSRYKTYIEQLGVKYPTVNP
jgi:aminobenzoyl-glutamate utilization protein B